MFCSIGQVQYFLATCPFCSLEILNDDPVIAEEAIIFEFHHFK